MSEKLNSQPKTKTQMNDFVVVTTSHRGVFAGRVEKNDGDQITLLDARMCIYWSSAVRGVVGLAKTGPDARSRVSPAAPRVRLNGVTSVIECADEARQAWEAEPWG
jgi:hypothetical protein